MQTIDVRDLGERIDEVVDSVLDGESFEIVRGGSAIAEIKPASATTRLRGDWSNYTSVDDLNADMAVWVNSVLSAPQLSGEEWLKRFEKLRAETSKKWPKGVTVQEAIDDIRRY